MEKLIQSIALAELVFKAMNQRDFTDVEPYIHEDIIFDFPGLERVEGAKRVLVFLKALLRKYRFLTFTMQEYIEDKDQDKVCVVWSNEGEDNSGMAYSSRGVTIIHLKDGKIKLISDYFKEPSFTKQN